MALVVRRHRHVVVAGLLLAWALALVGCQQAPPRVEILPGAPTATAEVSPGTTGTDPKVTPLPASPTPSPTQEPRRAWVVLEAAFDCGPSLGGSEHLRDYFLHWSLDGRWLVFDDRHTGIWVVDPAGTQIRRLTVANPGFYLTHSFSADVSPHSERIVYATCQFPNAQSSYERNPDPNIEVENEDMFYERGKYQYEIAAVNLEGGEPERLTHNKRLDIAPSWSPDGSRIAFVANPWVDARGFYKHSPNGQLLTMAADGSDVRRVLDARFRGVAIAPPAWSPDGERIAFLRNAGADAPFLHMLYTVRSDGSELTMIGRVLSLPAWSPDSERIALVQYAGDDVALFTVKADGSEPEVVATLIDRRTFDRVWGRYWIGHAAAPLLHTLAWSPDGAHLLHSCGTSVCVVTLDGISVGEFRGALAAWSPDGKRIAVRVVPRRRGDDLELGSVELYTVALDGSAEQVIVRRGRSLVAENSGYRDAKLGIAACREGFVVAEPAENPGLVQDCETLMGLRDTLSGSVILNWNTGTPLSNWEGVTVGDLPARVVGLDLKPQTGMLPLTGRIPPELAQLGELQTLDLSSNDFSGGIPPELGTLTNLQTLNLSWNLLSGSIPPELGKLTNLRNLRLYGNRLAGSIPQELGNLRSLEQFYLAAYELSGNIPAGIGNLTNLRELSFEYSSFSGSIPAELGNLTKLRKLSLIDNRLSGSIPSELGNLTSLQELYLKDNELGGSIPPELGALEQLIRLSLERNELEGCVAAELPEIWVQASGLKRCEASEGN